MTLLYQTLVEKYKKWISDSVNMYLVQVIKIVMICILCAVLFHMVFIRATQKELVINDAMHDNITQGDMLEDKLSLYQGLCIATVKDIVVYASDRSISGIVTAISNLEQEEQFSKVIYMDVDSKVYLSSGVVLKNDNPEELAELRQMKYSYGPRIIRRTDIDGTRHMCVVAPVKNRSAATRGFIVAYIDLDEKKLAESLDEELDFDSMFFTVDKDGEVLIQSDGELLGTDFSNLNNLYSYMFGFDMYDDSLEAFTEEVQKGNNGYTTIKTAKGNLLVFYSTLENMNENMRFISMQPVPNFSRLVQSMEKSQTLLIMLDLIIVAIMALLLSFMIHRSEVRLDKIAYRDTVTAARSKIYVRARGEELMMDPGKDNWMLIAIDIAGFRYVNELYGRERGDEVLQVLADSLLESMGKQEVLARNTADLFEVLVYYQSDWKRRMTSISHKVRSFARTVDIAVPIKIRAGAVRISASDDDFNLLLDKANSARKSIRNDSDDIFVMYSSQMQEEMAAREEIEGAQESALAHDEFKMFLQPKFNLQTGKLSGAEALVRWIKRDGTMVFPDQFIPVFENNAFIEKVDFHMLEMALDLQKRLIDEGINPVPISVNQSRILMLRPGYVERVKELFEKYDFDNSLVELEITETVFAEDKNAIINVMVQLHEMGCVIDMDDFGSGYSSLNTLREMPFDILKIDREFFDESNSEEGRKILQHIVAMAKDLGMKTVCEGVETEEDQNILRSIGCNYGQGYLYSRPIPANDFVNKFIYEAIWKRGELYLVNESVIEENIVDFWAKGDAFFAEAEETEQQ